MKDHARTEKELYTLFAEAMDSAMMDFINFMAKDREECAYHIAAKNANRHIIEMYNSFRGSIAAKETELVGEDKIRSFYELVSK